MKNKYLLITAAGVGLLRGAFFMDPLRALPKEHASLSPRSLQHRAITEARAESEHILPVPVLLCIQETVRMSERDIMSHISGQPGLYRISEQEIDPEEQETDPEEIDSPKPNFDTTFWELGSTAINGQQVGPVTVYDQKVTRSIRIQNTVFIIKVTTVVVKNKPGAGYLVDYRTYKCCDL